MIARACLAVLLGACAALAGCGEPHLLGVTCEDDCAPRPARFKTCLERELSPRFVEPDGGRFANVCHLLTLDDLTTPPGSELAYLSRVRIEGTPPGQDLDMRMATSLPSELRDGLYEDCSEILAARVPWVPLVVTVGESDNESYVEAPLAARPGDRLLIVKAFENMSSVLVETRVTVRLSCATERPALVTRAVRFGGPPVGGMIAPFDQLMRSSRCTFRDSASVSRLFRRDRSTVIFKVREPNAPDDGPLLWVSDQRIHWSHDLAEPIDFQPGDRLSWSCQLFNDSDTAFVIPPNAVDACMLFGFVQLPDGARDPELEGCD
jgi:hypothetical protein